MFTGRNIADLIKVTSYPYLHPDFNVDDLAHLLKLLELKVVKKFIGDFKEQPNEIQKFFYVDADKLTFYKIRNPFTLQESIFLKTKMVLGQGSYGKVRIGIDADNKEMWAIKTSKYMASYLIMRESAFHEFDILAALNKTRGVLERKMKTQPYMNASKQYNKLHVIQTLGKGKNLVDLGDKWKTLSPMRWLQFIIKLLMVVDAAHTDTLHCDLKPDNILYNFATDEFTLVDWGFAEKGKTAKKVEISGTKGFISPELYKTRKYNDKTEMYAIGEVISRLQSCNVDATSKNAIMQYVRTHMLEISEDERCSFKEAISYFKSLVNTYESQLDKVRRIAIISCQEFLNVSGEQLRSLKDIAQQKLVDEVWLLDMHAKDDQEFYLRIRDELKILHLPAPAQLITPTDPNLSLTSILRALPAKMDRLHTAYFFLTSQALSDEMRKGLFNEKIQALSYRNHYLAADSTELANHFLYTKILPYEQLVTLAEVLWEELNILNSTNLVPGSNALEGLSNDIKVLEDLLNHLTVLEAKKDLTENDVSDVLNLTYKNHFVDDPKIQQRLVLTRRQLDAFTDYYKNLNAKQSIAHRPT